MELTDAEKHASYINLIETIAALSRGDAMDDDWIDAQIDRVRHIRSYYSDMALVNIEREDSEFRNIALGLEMNLKVMISEIELFGTLDTDTYLEFSQGVLRLINMIEEDEDLSNAFAKLLR